MRTFRLTRPLPLLAEFYAISFSVELFCPSQVGGSERLVARLPWQDLMSARELDHAGHGILARQLATGYDVECGTLGEIILLRLIRQGCGEELAGPHSKLPFRFFNGGHHPRRDFR